MVKMVKMVKMVNKFPGIPLVVQNCDQMSAVNKIAYKGRFSAKLLINLHFLGITVYKSA